jgi:hypothetical protein
MPVKTLDTLQPIFGLVAFMILVWVVATGQFTIALPILIVMLTKVLVDLAFHIWSLRVYARWTGQRSLLAVGPATLAVFAEPFTFQLMRHAGAAWGWVTFLRGRPTWERQERVVAIPLDRTDIENSVPVRAEALERQRAP